MARFYETSYIQPKSAYVPLPFEAMAAKLQTMQASQDAYKQSIEGFDKPFSNLKNDLERAGQLKQDVQQKLETLRNYDFNDSANRPNIYKGIREVRDLYSPQGEIGLINAKYQAFQGEMERLNKVAEKDPIKAEYLKRQLMLDAIDPERRIIRNETGFQNTNISPLEDWQFKDPNSTLSLYMKDVMSEAGLWNTKWEDTPTNYIKMYKNVTQDRVTKQKLDYALRNRIAGDPDLVKSSHAIKTVHGYDGDDESNFWVEIGKDKNGNPIMGWNPNTILGRTAEGVAAGGVKSNLHVNSGTITDDVEKERANRKAILEESAFTTRGEIPGTTTTVEVTENGERIANLKTQLAQIDTSTVAGKQQAEKLQLELEIAENYQKQILNAATPTQSYQNIVNDQWNDINKYRTDPSSRSGFTNNPILMLMNTKEGNEKIKTKEDYDKWLKGEITIGSGPVIGGTKNLGKPDVFSEDYIRRYVVAATLNSVDEVKDGTLNVTYTTQALSGTGVDPINEQLTQFVNTRPTAFTTATGDFQQWEQKQMEKGAAKITITALEGSPDDSGRDGYLAWAFDKEGKPVGSTVIYPTNDQVARDAKNTVGNNLVNLYENNNTTAGQNNLRLGEQMVAGSASPVAGTVNKPKLISATKAMDDKVKTLKPGQSTSTKTTPQTVYRSGGVVQIRYNIVVAKDGNGNVITKYQPLVVTDKNKEGVPFLNGSEGYQGQNGDGTFFSIDDMQIALAKDDLGIAPNTVLKEDNLKVKR